MKKFVLLPLIAFCFLAISLWCYHNYNPRAVTLSFFETSDFTKSNKSVRLSSIFSELKKKGFEKNYDYFFAYSNASAKGKLSQESTQIVINKADIVVAIGDKASESLSKLVIAKKVKMLFVAHKKPSNFNEDLMTGILLEEKKETEDLSVQVAEKILTLMK